MFFDLHTYMYRIMQIVCGGKVSRFHDLVIRWKTFAIVQQFEAPCNIKEKIRWKTFAIGGYNLQKLQKFSTVNDLHYTVILSSPKINDAEISHEEHSMHILNVCMIATLYEYMCM